MYKVIAFGQVCLMGILQLLTDCMLVGALVTDFSWHDYLLGFAALVVVSAWGVKLAWGEWKEECKK